MIAPEYADLYNQLIGEIVTVKGSPNIHFYVDYVKISETDSFTVSLTTFGSAVMVGGPELLRLMTFLPADSYVTCANEWSKQKTAIVKFESDLNRQYLLKPQGD